MANAYFKNNKNGVVGKTADFPKLAKKFKGVFSKITEAEYNKGKKPKVSHDKVVAPIDNSIDIEAQAIIDKEKIEAHKLELSELEAKNPKTAKDNKRIKALTAMLSE